MAIKASELLNPNKDVKKIDKKAAKKPGYMQNKNKDGEPGERGLDGNKEMAIVRYRVDKMSEKESSKGNRANQDLSEDWAMSLTMGSNLSKTGGGVSANRIAVMQVQKERN